MLRNLRAEIARRNLSQAAVAVRTGMSEARLSRVMTGKARARASERRRIARVLRVRQAVVFPYVRMRLLRLRNRQRARRTRKGDAPQQRPTRKVPGRQRIQGKK